MAKAAILFSDLAPIGTHVRAALPWTVVPIWNAEGIEACDAAFVADVGLDDGCAFEMLRDTLGRHGGPKTPFLVLVRDREITTYARANALGATHILPVDAEPDQIAEAIGLEAPRAFDGQALWIGARTRPEAPADTAAAPAVAEVAEVPQLGVLVDTVHSALTSILASARDSKPVAPETLKLGADALVAAVKDHCIRDWIDRVRRYDDVTYQHVLLVAGLVTALSVRLGLSANRQSLLAQGALVHDIGKASIPQTILNKPGPLTDAETTVMRTHPSRGYYMIANQRGIDPLIVDVVLHHHEYLDGSGYPQRLRREQISEASRLVTICDIYAALIERRSYKSPMAPAESYATLVDMGDKLDRGLLDVFRTVVAAD